MSQIEQFSQEYIDKNTPEKEMLFKSFLDSQEPYTSVSYTHLTLPTTPYV